jgi:hypothetical protein
MRRKLGELGPDFVERQPDPLSEHDERYPAKNCSGVAPLARASPFRSDETSLLIEPQRGSGDTAAPRHLADQ